MKNSFSTFKSIYVQAPKAFNEPLLRYCLNSVLNCHFKFKEKSSHVILLLKLLTLLLIMMYQISQTLHAA